MSNRHGIDSLEYVECQRARWAAQGVIPKSMMVVEFYGTGDPAFGGSADDRALGPNGAILSRIDMLSVKPLVFVSIDDAHEAAKTVVNRRPNSMLGLSISWR